MHAVLENPPVVDQTELAPAPAQTPPWLIAAPPAPPVAAVATPTEPAVKWDSPHAHISMKHLFTQKEQEDVWKAIFKGYGTPVVAVADPVDADTAILKAADQWCQPGYPRARTEGTGQPDEMMEFGTGLVDDMEVARFLDWCAERIVRGGWVQGAETSGSMVCMIGAINWRGRQAASRGSSTRALVLHRRAENAMLTFVNSLGASGIPEWNDTPGRTMSEVVNAFRTVAQQMRVISTPRFADPDWYQTWTAYRTPASPVPPFPGFDLASA